MGSLWVSYSQTKVAQLHNRQSVRPILQIRRIKAYDGQSAGIRIINAGLGPAIVTNTVVKLDTENLGQWRGEAHERISAPLPIRPKVYSLREGSVILAGQSTYLIHLDEFDDAQHGWFWDLINRRLMVEVHYESLYGGEDFNVTLRPR